MARKNTPSQYKCSVCGEFGHNARTCPQRADRKKSDTQILKEQRAAKRAIREARKAAKLAKSATIEQPVVEVAPVAPPQPDEVEQVLRLLAEVDQQINSASDDEESGDFSSIPTVWVDEDSASA